MAKISDKERAVFRELYKTMLENFDSADMMTITDYARELDKILKGAKERAKDDMKSMGHA